MTNRQDAYPVWIYWTEMIHVSGGLGGIAKDFIMLIRMTHNLKLMSYLFMEFSIEYFWTVSDCG